MRAKLYEQYYKLGFGHYIFKEVMGLNKPDKAVKRFYYILISTALMIGILVF